MKLDLNDMLYSLSYALDCVEAEIFGVKPFHSERVAYLCIQIAKAYDLSQEDMLHLTAAAVSKKRTPDSLRAVRCPF